MPDWRASRCIECYGTDQHAETYTNCGCQTRPIQEGDQVTIGPGPKTWRVDAVGRIGNKPPFARLRDQNWNRITMPLDTLNRQGPTDGP